MTDIFEIDFEPLGRRTQARSGQTLLEAAQSAGVGLASVCGGIGTCEECRVRLASGRLTPPTLLEQAVFTQAELTAGFRLACQAEPLSDVKLDIPPESLTAAQRLQLDGEETHLELHPAVRGRTAYGMAVDIGTTKLAAFLVDLQTGQTLARSGAMNPQIAYGEDVISRIAFAGREAGGAKKLQSVLVETLNTLLSGLCDEAQVSTNLVLDAVLVGNTAMHHLFAGLPVEQLGHAPFSPASTEALSIPAADLGLNLGPGAQVYLPPVIAGYVGADHIAMLLATGITSVVDKVRSQDRTAQLEKQLNPARSSKLRGKNIIALDIGTNTEIALISDEKVTCCSCASGPAFEGAHIHEGMRAAPGAIERALWSNGKILWQTIAAQPPVGICGSGILDIVAALLDGGLVKPTGTLQNSAEQIQNGGYVLVPASQTALGRDLIVTRKDVNEIQLAKSAIRSGIEVLLAEAGLNYSDLDDFIVAGAFGTYLDLRSAVRTGMFPPLPLDKFRQIGNAAGVGARQMLISLDKRREAEQLASRIGYVELTSRPAFTTLFMEHLSFQV